MSWMLFGLFNPKCFVMLQRALVHKERLEAREIRTRPVEDSEAVRVAITPVVEPRSSKPWQAGKRIDVITEAHEEHRTGQVGEGETSLKVLHDEDARGANAQPREIGKRRAKVRKLTDVSPEIGVQNPQAKERGHGPETAEIVEGLLERPGSAYGAEKVRQ